MSLFNRMLVRGTVVLARASSKMQALQMRLTAGEVRGDMEHFEPYGFTSNPLAGAEGIAAFIGGDRSHGLLLVVADRRYRLQGLESGEVAIYTDEGDKVHFKRGKVIDIETNTLNIKAATAVNFDTPQITRPERSFPRATRLPAASVRSLICTAACAPVPTRAGRPLEVADDYRRLLAGFVAALGDHQSVHLAPRRSGRSV